LIQNFGAIRIFWLTLQRADFKFQKFGEASSKSQTYQTGI